jgi:hypothetical protein
MTFEKTVEVFGITLQVQGNYESEAATRDIPSYFECEIYSVHSEHGQDITDIVSDRAMSIIENRLAEILP